MSERGKLVVITAPSGCGKSTIVEYLLKKRDNLRFSVSATTRPPRVGDVNGVNYYFVDRAEFDRMIKNDEFIEYAIYVDNCYGTPRAPLEKNLEEGFDVLLDIEVKGAMQIREKCPEALMIFIMPPSFEELERRLVSRGKDSMDVILRRLEEAKLECQSADKFDYIVVNDVVERAAEEISALIDSLK